MARIKRERKSVAAARGDFAGALAPFFATVAEHLAAQITAARADVVGKLAKAEADPADIDAILAALDFGDWATLIPSLEPILARIAHDGITVAFAQLDVDPEADLVHQVNAKALAWAKARAAELVGMRYTADGDIEENPDPMWAITDSTREMLRTAIGDAIDEGTSTSDLATQLADDYAFSDTRAETIARTELARADVAGNMLAYRDSGLVSGKRWLLGSEHGDPDECDDAAELGVVDLDDDFGGIGDPPAHPNCVCDVIPVLAGDDD